MAQTEPASDGPDLISGGSGRTPALEAPRGARCRSLRTMSRISIEASDSRWCDWPGC